MKIALIQQHASWDQEANRSRGLAAARKAAADGAQVIAFAELAFDRFYPQVPATLDLLDRAESIPGPTTDAFCALAVQGAEVVFIPKAGSVGEWPEGLYEAEMRVTAFHNGYFTALCNRVGKEENLVFSEESFVCAPNGEVLARAQQGTDEILHCELDLAKVSQSNARRLFLRDRRPELYKDWI